MFAVVFSIIWPSSLEVHRTPWLEAKLQDPALCRDSVCFCFPSNFFIVYFSIYIYLGLSLCYIILYMLELLKEKVSIIKGADHIHMCMYICHVHTPLPDQCKWQKMTIKDLFKFCRKHCKITQYIMKQQVGFGAGTCTEYGVHFWYLEFLSQNVVSKSHMWHS